MKLTYPICAFYFVLINRHFLKRNKSTERTLNSSTTCNYDGGRKWVSDECLRREQTPSCSGSVFCGNYQSYGSVKQTTKEESQAQPHLEQLGQKPLLANGDVLLLNRLDQNTISLLQCPPPTTSPPANKLNKQATKAHEPGFTKSSSINDKNFFHADKNELATISKSRSHSTGAKLKTALSKVFRKPPSGVKGGRVLQPLGRLASKFHWRPKGNQSLKDTEINKGAIKAAVSCEELDQRTDAESHGQRRWCSTDALQNMNVSSIEHQQGLVRWVEQLERDDGTSDCESLFSVDSLSSAYATALAEQLRHEETSDAESEDSEMSKDSLAVGNNGELSTVKRCRRAVMPVYSLVTHFGFSSDQRSPTTEPCCQKLPVAPADVYWSQQASAKTKQVDPAWRSSSHISLVANSRSRDTVDKLTEEFGNMLIPSISVPRSISSVEEPENLQVLSDAWSSAEAAESPRVHRDSLPLPKQIMLRHAESSSTLTGMSLSNSQSGSRSNGSIATSTEGLNTLKNSHDMSGELKAHGASGDILNSGNHEDSTCFKGQLHTNTTLPASDQTVSLADVSQPPRATSVRSHASADVHDVKLLDIISSDVETCSTSCPSLSATGVKMQDEMPTALHLLRSSTKKKTPDLRDDDSYFTKAECAPVKWDENLELLVAPQQESVQRARKTSRKRSKHHKVAFMRGLKVPKRSNNKEFVTFSRTPGDLMEDVRPEDQKNRCVSANKECVVEPVCVTDDAASETKNKNQEPSGQVFYNLVKHEDESSQYDKELTEDEHGAHKKGFKQTANGKCPTESHRQRRDCAKHTCKSDAICSAIDLRISEVVKEHMTPSVICRDGAPKGRSQSLNALSCACCVSFDRNKWTEEQLTVDINDMNEGMDFCKVPSVETVMSNSALVTTEQLIPDMPVEPKARLECFSPQENPVSPPKLPRDIYKGDEHKVTFPLHLVTKDICSQCLNSQTSSDVPQTSSDAPHVKADHIDQLQAQPPGPGLHHMSRETPWVCSHPHGCGCAASEDPCRKINHYLCKQDSPKMIQHFQTSPTTSTPEGGLHELKADERLCIHVEQDSGARVKPSVTAQDQLSCQQMLLQNFAQTRVVNMNYGEKCPDPSSSRCNPSELVKTCEKKSDKGVRTCSFMKQHKTCSEGVTSKCLSSVGKLNLIQNGCSYVTSKEITVNPTVVTAENPALKDKKVKTKKFRKTCPTSNSSSEEDEEENSELRRSTLIPQRVSNSKPDIRWARSSREELSSSESASKSKMATSDGNFGNVDAYITKQLTLCPREEIHAADPERDDLYAKRSGSCFHFASSDINPYVHQWPHGDSNQHKSPEFGSAADLSSKCPLLNNSERRMTRCCSAENGLNEHNSPFKSHLSAYATSKGLSSTLSSIEDYKRSSEDTHGCSVKSSSSGTEAAGASSSQVDEIMLVYSEQESKMRRAQAQRSKRRTCEHSTQTECGAWKKNLRHRRCSVDVRSSQRSNVDIRGSPAWASMENISAHITKLIDSTSDLLGDIQGMRTGDVSKSSSRSISISYDESMIQHCSPKTSLDVGIQTEGTTEVGVHPTRREQHKSHHIDVIVTVIGSEDVRVSEEQNADSVMNHHTDEKMLSIPHLRLNRSEVVSLRSVDSKPVADHHRRVSASSSQPLRSSTPDSCGCRNVVMSEIPTRLSKKRCQELLSPDSSKRPSAFVQKSATYTDRASSPILALGTRFQLRHGGQRSMCSRSNRKDPRHRSEDDSPTVLCASGDGPSPRLLCDVSSTKSETGSLQWESEVRCSSPQGSEKCFLRPHLSLDRYTDTDNKEVDYKDLDQCSSRRQVTSQRWSTWTAQNHFSPTVRDMAVHKHNFTGDYVDRCTEDDQTSLTPSECNTQVLVNTKPDPSLSPQEDLQGVPEDLPLHNKFTNWSGICHRPRSNKQSRERGEMGSLALNLEASDRRAVEILKLRQEREQVMATVNLRTGVTPLTVELTEAKIHYGLGETDALLKILSPRSKEEPRPLSTGPTKQQLYDR